MSHVIHVANADGLNATLNGATVPVVVKFGAKWCAPCKAIEPTLESLAKKLDGKLVILSVDIDELPDLAGQYNLMGVPSIFVFVNGDLVKRVSTNVTPRSVKKLVEGIAA